MGKRKTGTFSILAISSDSKLMGVAVASGSTSVGDRVPYARPGVGVIATQANTNIAYGINGLELLTKGLAPKEALQRLLMEDPENELRQVAIMDFKKRKAVFTGAKTPKFHEELVGEDYIVIGNVLSDKKVVNSMAKKFENSGGDLAQRLTTALKAGKESGGDKRGEKSAALIVVDAEKVKAEIKIDVHEKPIEELCRKLRILRENDMETLFV
jgi:uncharacterized Ntn-hydrolase superfamily protein